jgi:hypothetical protein
MKTKLIQYIASLTLAFIACGGSAAADPLDKLPKPEDPVVLLSDAEVAQFVKNIRDSGLNSLKWDKDGWDDLWVMLQRAYDKNYKFEPNAKNKDTDGDGMTDYEEMLTHRNATRAEPVYTKEQLIEQVRESRRQAIAHWHAEDGRWKQALKEAAPNIRSHIPNGRLNPDELQAQAEQSYAALRAAGAEAKRLQPLLDEQLKGEAARRGVPIEENLPLGGKKRLSGFLGDSPFYMGDSNYLAAASISADELWPWGVNGANAPFANNPTGFNLTGAGQTLGVWEVGGGVRLTHAELTGRVVQADPATETVTLDASGL